MGVQIKPSTVDTDRLFNIGGCEYEKGNWSLFYLNKQVDGSGVIVNEAEVQLGIVNKLDLNNTLQDALIFSNYDDASNVPYTSLNALITDLGPLLNL